MSPQAFCILLGVFFLLSALLKAASSLEFAVQISYYQIVRRPDVVRVLALVVIGFEATLGVAIIVLALVERWRRRLLVVAALVLVGFTLLILWGWAFHDLADCGCFGKYLRMTPGWSVAKNVVLLGIVGAGFRREKRWRRETEPRQDATAVAARGLRRFIGLGVSISVGAAVVLCLVSLAAGGLSAPGRPIMERMPMKDALSSRSAQAEPTAAGGGAPHAAGAFGQKEAVEAERHSSQAAPGPHIPVPPLVRSPGQDYYFVAMLSESCDKCAEIVEELNRLATNPDMPRVMAFVLGGEAELSAFRTRYRPGFPTAAMPPLEFLSNIGDAPPRFHLVRKDCSLKHWDSSVPRVPDILDAVLDSM